MNTGWLCPRCNVVHAPSVLRCDCKAVEQPPEPTKPHVCFLPGYRTCTTQGPEECPVFCPLSAKRAGEQANPQMGDCRCPTGHLCSESAWACPRRFGPPSITTAGNAGEPT
jgi:hypothetical protein